MTFLQFMGWVWFSVSAILGAIVFFQCMKESEIPMPERFMRSSFVAVAFACIWWIGGLIRILPPKAKAWLSCREVLK